MSLRALSVTSLFLSYVLLGSAKECGTQAGGALGPGGLCCGVEWGWCGTSDAHCKKENGCQSHCEEDDDNENETAGGGGGDINGGIANLISREMFEQMFLYKDDARCHAVGFYTYDAFIAAANSFPKFASTGDNATRLREIAAFLGQTSNGTSGGVGGWNPPDGPYAWGYCYKEEVNPTSNYCDSGNQQYPCVSGQKYYGRGPIQLSWNYNYGPCGEYLGLDLLSDPNLLVSNSTTSFKSAFWFWMTEQPPKPSCHDVITEAWTPSDSDKKAGRKPGYGVITNIINGGEECGKGQDARVEDRIGFYKRYCDILGVSYGDNLDCYNQSPFNIGLSEAAM